LNKVAARSDCGFFGSLRAEIPSAIAMLVVSVMFLVSLAGDDSAQSVVLHAALIAFGFTHAAYSAYLRSTLRSKHSEALSWKTDVLVIRDGTEVHVDSTTLVPGDVVLLNAGERVCADLCIRYIEDLSIEFEGAQRKAKKTSTAKLPDAPNVALAGSIVVSGCGKGIVFATGAHTYAA
jgi:magnesium-transporting ATPase (P-type)